MAKISPIGSEEWYTDLRLRGVSSVFREHGIKAQEPVVGETELVHAEDGDDELAEIHDETEELLSILYA